MGEIEDACGRANRVMFSKLTRVSNGHAPPRKISERRTSSSVDGMQG